jgi:hypothetical protein
MALEIRNETAADVLEIEALTASAFLNVPHASHTEQYIVNALRDAGTLAVLASGSIRTLLFRMSHRNISKRSRSAHPCHAASSPTTGHSASRLKQGLPSSSAR